APFETQFSYITLACSAGVRCALVTVAPAILAILRMSLRILAAGSGSGTPSSPGSCGGDIVAFMGDPLTIVMGTPSATSRPNSHVIDLKRIYRLAEVGTTASGAR